MTTPCASYRVRGATQGQFRSALRTRPATLIAFDVLADAGIDVRSEPIVKRKERLRARVSPAPHLRPLMPIEAEGEWLFAQAEATRLEGIVAKRKGSRYVAGRSRDWLKIKTAHGREVEAKRFEYRRR